MSKLPVLLLYCPLCRRIVLWIKDEGPLSLDIERRLDRQNLECPQCGNPIGLIRIKGSKMEDENGPTKCITTNVYPKRLHHYTSIETAFKILRSQTIRFSRLDQVNDPLEAYTEDFLAEASKYVFVSCWTYSPRESILHWGRYTSDSGCRLSLHSTMFSVDGKIKVFGVDTDWIVGETFNDIGSTISLKSELRIRIENDLLAEVGIPEYNVSRHLYGPTYVGYSPDESNIRPRLVKDREFSMLNIGIWKTDYWQDEMEVRFRKYATDGDADTLTLNEWESEDSPFKSYKRVLDSYIDVPVDRKVMNLAEILLGPLADDVEANELKEYCRQNYPGITISNSTIKMRR